MNVVFNLYHFGIKVMAPFISDNFLLGGIIFFQIGRFLVFLMLRGKIRVSLATFNENYPYMSNVAQLCPTLKLLFFNYLTTNLSTYG